MHASTMTITERAIYAPNTLDLPELMEELNKFRELGSDPESLEDELRELREVEEKPNDYDDLKSFFDDMVETWEDTLANGRWPCPEPCDGNLLQAIADDMQQGAEAISLIERFLAGEAARDDLMVFFKEVTAK